MQVIFSLLDLQSEKFRDKEVLEAFRESQSRVISMSLIHEELYREGEADTLDFSAYLQNLVKNLFHTYMIKSKNICLFMNLEKNAFFDMDIAVPLGMIVNELVSNSLKHAFPGQKAGEIQIKLTGEKVTDELIDDNRKHKRKDTGYTLIVSDNGVGIPENIDLENSDTLGMQLVDILVDQLDGEIEIKRDKGTEFTIRFSNI
ncbi:sensory transduction histidine kinase [Methanosarcina horonobensis HB-1 = JCM 15518]|uniref:Sensory transduction histidine kinase n=1 Tax=Methanosarcina horonobensis HB-1 = JCM 15518 TaxID=1434110 RepID=A0A0E3SCU4_9EURY|nr:sensory transduction histidine kinase [Methanosarcina horonobensis HB-1 = JCM 15518]